jgi:chromate transporter
MAEESKQEEPPTVVEESVEAVESGKDGIAVDVDGKTDTGKLENGETFEPAADNEENGDDDEQKVRMKVAADAPWKDRMWEVFSTFWPLGLIAFGGPQAHVAILRDHLVVQRDWLDEEQFTELFAIGQGLPGPTSTQLVISTALSRAGPLGGLMAFFLWNLPGLIILTTCGVLLAEFIDPNDPPFWLVGLPPAAISLVFKAFYGFGMKLDSLGVVLALISALITILINNDRRIEPTASQWVFPVTLAFGGLVTYIDHKRATPFSNYGSPSKGWDRDSDETMKRIGIPLWVGALIFLVWVFVLVLVIVLKDVVGVDNVYLEIFETMYRIGTLIFGGGQVVLPMLQDEVVPSWMTKDQFLQGLGLAQSMPGPLFNFSSYLGAVYQGVPGALVAFCGLFAPGVILIFAVVRARLQYHCVLCHTTYLAVSKINQRKPSLLCQLLFFLLIPAIATATATATAARFHSGPAFVISWPSRPS